MSTQALRWIRASLVGMASFSMLASPCLATPPQSAATRQAPVAKGTDKAASVRPNGVRMSSKPKQLDIKLGANRTLSGQLLSQAGKPHAGAPISIWQQRKLVGSTKTDVHGKYQFAGLRGGSYTLKTEAGAVACRVWAAKVAPPSARESLLIVPNVCTVRGQRPIEEVFPYNPFLMGTVIAAAIAIPIAVHNSGEDDADGS